MVTMTIRSKVFRAMLRSVSVLLFGFLCHASSEANPGPLKLISTIPLPGVEGRFDHFSLDAKGKRLFVAALGNNSLEVIDLAEGKHLQSVRDLRKPQGVLCLPDLDRLCVACGEEGTCRIYELTTLKLLKTIGSLPDADNIRQDKGAPLVLVGYGDGALATIDLKKEEKVADTKLPSHPESFQIESIFSRIFVNLPEAKQIQLIDRKSTRSATWPMEKFQANFPMALGDTGNCLLVGCRKPPRFVVLDKDSGKIIADYAISGDTDDLFFDARRKRIYVICGEGSVDIFEQLSRDQYKSLPKIPTATGARTGFFSSDLDQLFVAVPHRGNQQAEIRVFKPE